MRLVKDDACMHGLYFHFWVSIHKHNLQLHCPFWRDQRSSCWIDGTCYTRLQQTEANAKIANKGHKRPIILSRLLVFPKLTLKIFLWKYFSQWKTKAVIFATLRERFVSHVVMNFYHFWCIGWLSHSRTFGCTLDSCHGNLSCDRAHSGGIHVQTQMNDMWLLKGNNCCQLLLVDSRLQLLK